MRHIGMAMTAHKSRRFCCLATICRDLAAFTHAFAADQLSYRDSRESQRLGACGFTKQPFA
jgi:hypothetical protein